GSKVRWSMRGAAIGLSLLVAATAAIVATRGTLLGTGAVAVALPFAYLRSSRLVRRSIAAAVIAGAFFSVAALSVALTPLGQRLANSDAEIRSRFVVFEGARQAFEDRPLFGYGTDGFGVAFPRYRQ